MTGAALLLGRAAPRPALRPYVRALHAYVEVRPGPPSRRELPVAQSVLIVNLGAPLWIGQDGRWERFDDGLVAGMDDRSVFSSTRGGLQEGLQVMLTPLGCRRLAGVAMHELAHRSVALGDVLGPRWPRLVERLRATPSWALRLEALQQALGRRLLDAPPEPADVVRAWQRLEETGGALRVADLAAELRCSPRHLNARFRDHVGIAPKRAARVLRFQRAVGLLESGAAQARAAAEAGYTDQAHLSREVRRLTGLPPGALLAERRSVPYKIGPLPFA